MTPTFEEMLLERLIRLEDKLDRVRTQDLVDVKTEIARLVTENRVHSKLHSTVGSIAAIIVSAVIGNLRIK